MKTLFLFILSTSLSFSGLANIGDKWVKDTCHLNGPVKSIIYSYDFVYYPKRIEWEKYTFEYNRQRYMIKHNKSGSWGGENFNAYYRIYDESGVKCQIAYYLQDGDTSSWTQFYYNDQGNWSESKYFTGGRLWNTKTYTYNEQNLMTGFICKTIKGDIFPESFKYDKKGHLIYHERLSSTSKKFEFWTYNEQGYLIEEMHIDSNWASRTTVFMGNDNDPDSSKTENYSKKAYTKDSFVFSYKYNELGLNIEKIKSDLDGNLITKETFTYNENGDPDTRKIYTREKDETNTLTYEYTYDLYKNWVTKVTKRNGELFEKASQKITYYDV